MRREEEKNGNREIVFELTVLSFLASAYYSIA